LITRLRKYGAGGDFEPIDHPPELCGYCEAAERMTWDMPGVVFFEGDDGSIHRVEFLGVELGARGFLCQPVTHEQFRAEVSA
jgi:hypothetical protein